MHCLCLEREWAEMESMGDLKGILEERVNLSPKRCVLFENGHRLYEICVNDDFVFVKKYMRKMQRYNGESDIEIEMEFENGLNEGNATEFVDFERFESFKYEQAMMVKDRGNGLVRNWRLRE